MLVVLQRLLALLVVGLALTVVGEAPAHAACTCQRPPVAQQVSDADAVFSGTVTMASGPTTSGKRQIMSYDVKVDRVYKGEAITSRTVTVKSDADPSKCGLTGMTSGTRYLFFVRLNDANLLANRCSGTGPARSAKTEKVKAILGEGSTPVPPKPEKATFTPVADSEPPELTRLAAPGAAMVVVGLLGLMLFAALGRSRRT